MTPAEQSLVKIQEIINSLTLEDKWRVDDCLHALDALREQYGKHYELAVGFHATELAIEGAKESYTVERQLAPEICSCAKL